MRALHFQRVVGSGAFGAVYLCDLVADKGFRRQVAVKVLQRDHPNAQMFMSRVRDEARLLGLLQDEHILKVLEIVSVDGRDAVVMEYVEGLDLAALIEAKHRPPARALAELGGAMAGALHRAHTAVHPATGVPLNVIHRDVKPANVMVTSRGGVKLLDFGVARARFEARESFTGQFVLGTLNYMAPEYIVTGDVSPAADVYGLGLVIWEAAIGEVFGQPRLKLEQHLPRQAAQLARIVGEFEPLAPLLGRMLAWDPKQRPDTMEVEQELVALADNIRGSGLRAWCGTVVPELLAKRAKGKDDSGLVGRQIQLAEGPGEAPEASLPALPRPLDARPAADPPNTLAALGRPPAPRVPTVAPVPERRVPTVAPALASAAVTPASEISEATPSPRFAPARAEPLPAAAPARGQTNRAPAAVEPESRPPVAGSDTLAPGSTRKRARARAPSTALLIVQGLVVGGGIGVLMVLLVIMVFLLRRFL